MDIVDLEYQKDENLLKTDVEKLQRWLKSQSHLPKMTEQEIIWFLQSNYYSNESTKQNIDTFFTMKTLGPEVLRNRNMESIQVSAEASVFTVLPEKTPEGYTVVFSTLLDKAPEKFIMEQIVKMVDMVIMLDLYKNGTHNGLVLCFDMGGVTFAHIAGLSIVSMKKFIYYFQDALPVRLKGLHFFNTTSVMDTLLKLFKPFMKKKLFDVLHLHPTFHDLNNFVPLELFPQDFGGKAESSEVFHERMLKNFTENASFFDYQDGQSVDESKRPDKPKTSSEIFGIDGTFKKLELD